MKWFNWHGFVVLSELDVSADGGIQVEYKHSSGRWYPCSMMPNFTEETMFGPSNGQDWNFATHFLGYVEGYLIRDNQVYWNYPVNFGGIPEQKEWILRVRRSSNGGKVEHDEEITVVIDSGGVVFLNNFLEWENVNPQPYDHMQGWRTRDPEDVPNDWYVASDELGSPRLVSFGMAKLPPVSYCPGVAGKYDVYLAIRENLLQCRVSLPGKKPYNIYLSSRIMPGTCFNHEIYLDTCDFTETDKIVIGRCPATERNAQQRFGDIFYLKLVPADRVADRRPDYAKPDWETVFYSEPYSLCYYGDMQNEEQAGEIADRYAELGVDKVVCQTGRIGTRMMHWKSIAGPLLSPTMGDDREISDGMGEAMKRMDVMAELGKACRSRGMKFIAEMGVNCIYPGSALSCQWTQEHMHCVHPVHPVSLDYSLDEVREFAAINYSELADYEIDGICVNCTRYPFGVTSDDLVDLFRRIVRKIGPQRRSELELSISIITGLPDFYTALETLLEENLVDAVFVGRLNTLSPVIDLKPFRALLDQYPGKKLYGKIDGWMANYGGFNSLRQPVPSDCDYLARFYSEAGADGLFFYQSEQVIIDPFVCRYVKSLKA